MAGAGAALLGACGASGPSTPAAATGGAGAMAAPPMHNLPRTPAFTTRGIVLTVDDLTLDWPERAHAAGLTTIALHVREAASLTLVPFMLSDAGRRFADRCLMLGLDVEFEFHAMSDLLPRDLFDKDPTLFRTNEKCERTPDANLCVHTPAALDIAAGNAIAMARVLRPTTHRYFFWGDDAAAWCRCPCCSPLSDSDQALTLENHMLGALRSEDPQATLCHLAYASTSAPPAEVKPREGIFLEFAPLGRRYDISLAETNDGSEYTTVDDLWRNLEVFPAETAKVLEYWLDASMFSGWQPKPARKLPYVHALVAEDLAVYRGLGIQHVSSFGVYIDDQYVKLYGEPPIGDYGSLLLQT